MILSLWTKKKKERKEREKEKEKSSQSKWNESDSNHCILNWSEERGRDQSE